MLSATAQVPSRAVAGWAFAGELSLKGELVATPGVLSVAIAAARAGLYGVVVPAANALEAAQVDGLRVVGAGTLSEVVGCLRGTWEPSPLTEVAPAEPAARSVDLSEVRGQAPARRALEVAAAGGHNVFMVGSPGAGKTMLARRFATILPELSRQEALEASQLHSVAGLLAGRGILTHPPFRAPHHSISTAGLLGGGTGFLRPGEVSLASHGVLFLDELTEFRRDAVESLRQPLALGPSTLTAAPRCTTAPAAPAAERQRGADRARDEPDRCRGARPHHRRERALPSSSRVRSMRTRSASGAMNDHREPDDHGRHCGHGRLRQGDPGLHSHTRSTWTSTRSRGSRQTRPTSGLRAGSRSASRLRTRCGSSISCRSRSASRGPQQRGSSRRGPSPEVNVHGAAADALVSFDAAPTHASVDVMQALTRAMPWEEHAACRDSYTEDRRAGTWIIDPSAKSSTPESVFAKLVICDGCPVRAECLRFALDAEFEVFGIWGGSTSIERKTLISRHGVPQRTRDRGEDVALGYAGARRRQADVAEEILTRTHAQRLQRWQRFARLARAARERGEKYQVPRRRIAGPMRRALAISARLKATPVILL